MLTGSSHSWSMCLRCHWQARLNRTGLMLSRRWRWRWGGGLASFAHNAGRKSCTAKCSNQQCTSFQLPLGDSQTLQERTKLDLETVILVFFCAFLLWMPSVEPLQGFAMQNSTYMPAWQVLLLSLKINVSDTSRTAEEGRELKDLRLGIPNHNGPNQEKCKCWHPRKQLQRRYD